MRPQQAFARRVGEDCTSAASQDAGRNTKFRQIRLLRRPNG